MSSSSQGYQQAWNNLSAKLEGLDKNAYHFTPDNMYLNAAPMTMVDHRMASAAAAASSTREDKDADGLFEQGMQLIQPSPSVDFNSQANPTSNPNLT